MRGQVFGDALRRVLKGAGLDCVCACCGGLSATSPGSVLVREGERLAECPECGLYLDATGRPVGVRHADGQIYLRVIRLNPTRRRDLPPLVGCEEVR